jgi:type I restriction enzyme R subunit
MLEHEALAQLAAANTREQFDASPDFKDAMIQSVAEGFDSYSEMAKQVLNSPKLQEGLAALLGDLVYAGFAKRRHRDLQSPVG